MQDEFETKLSRMFAERRESLEQHESAQFVHGVMTQVHRHSRFQWVLYVTLLVTFVGAIAASIIWFANQGITGHEITGHGSFIIRYSTETVSQFNIDLALSAMGLIVAGFLCFRRRIRFG